MLNRQTYARDCFAAGYNYDELYRLTSAQNPLLPATESFSYDKVGNRLTSADATGWNYNANNALVGYDGVNYTYDQNGNTVTKSNSGQTTTFAYSAKDRLEQVNLPDGKIAIYKYDPFGRRISKTVDGAVTYFMYSDEGLVAEMSSAGAVVKSYGWKPNSTWGTDPVLMKEGSQTYFYHNDHLGTPQKMTDSTGAVVWSATYTAFGEATVDAASTVVNNLRFPGQYYDAETGLHYNWFRYYDPRTGRYITEDPIGLSGGANLYGYVGNDPINRIDPMGLKTCNNQKDCRRDAALKLIQFAEFGNVSDDNYSKLFGGSTFSGYLKHPNIKIKAGKYTSTSAGAYQINYPSWQSYIKSTGPHDFSPSSQDTYALWRINDAGAMDDVDEGNVSGMIDDLNGIWVSLPGGSQQRKGLTKGVAEAMFNMFYNNCMAGK